MRVLWITEPASFIGGAETYIFQTAELLKAQGMHSTLLYNPLLKTDAKFLTAFDQAFPIADLRKQLPEIPYDLIFVHQLQNLNDLRALLYSPKPIVRFIHDLELFCLRGSKLPLFSNTACQCKPGIQCYPFGFSLVKKENKIKVKTLRHLRKLQEVNRQFDGFLVASKFMRQQLIDNGFDTEKITVIPLYAPRPEDIDENVKKKSGLLFAGQLLRTKGVDVLIEAMSRTNTKPTLSIAGAGPLKSEYERLVTKFRLEDRIQFLGKLSSRDLQRCYQNAACTIYPVRWPEPFGLIGPESMRYGTPVIASDIGGISEWLEPNRNGLMVAPNDPAGLANAIDTLMSSPKLAEMCLYAKKSYEQNFTPEIYVERLKGYLKKIFEQHEKYTPSSSTQVDSLIYTLHEDAKVLFQKHVPDLTAALLIGGYGKGEGGVAEIDGQEHPHNNLDFLLVTKTKYTRSQAWDLVEPLRHKYGIGIDISTVTENKLKRSAPLLIWHELCYGHKLICGDPSFVRSLPFHSLSCVPAEEFADLMVNRGTLLVINDWICTEYPFYQDKYLKTLIKHLMKATIGFGDALLYHLNDYHWSYLAKQDRIKNQQQVPIEFRKHYEQAAAFRFKPDYTPFSEEDISSLLAQRKSELKNVYLQCTKNEKKAHLNFLWVKQKIKGIIHPPEQLHGEDLMEKITYCLMSPKERLRYLFPKIAFGNPTAEERKNYLRQWSRLHDPSLIPILEGKGWFT